MLHELNHHRTFASLDVEKAFDAQQIRAPQLHQRVHRPRENGPRHRPIVCQHEAADAVAVHRLGHEGVALIGGRLGQAGGVELAIHGLQDFGAGIERAQLRRER